MEPVNKLSWQFPIAPNTVRGQATHLSLSEDKKILAYGSMTNVVLRNIEVYTLLFYCQNVYGDVRIFTNHKAPISCVRFGKKNGLIGSGDQKGEFKIWNHEHPKFNVSFESQILNDHIRDIAFTDDGNKGVAVGEGVIKYFRDIYCQCRIYL